MSRKNTHSVLYLRERGGQLYIDGSTAVQIDGYENADSEIIPSLRVVDRDKVERKERRALRRMVMTIGTMAVILVAGVYSLFWYINVQSQLSQVVTEVGTLSSRYEALVTENDERLAEIEQSVDMETIRERAVNKLHMTYASEGQVIGYSPDVLDSVTQVVTVGE